MPQFVVLIHDHPFLHWDLMLEAGTALRTWRLHAPPDAATPVAAEELPEHRREYLAYEGPVSGGRGEVRRWDAGEFTLLAETAECLDVHFGGARLRGRARLERSPADADWIFSLTASRET
jgi:hypothetical protein